jgi:hypothetical protein
MHVKHAILVLTITVGCYHFFLEKKKRQRENACMISYERDVRTECDPS